MRRVCVSSTNLSALRRISREHPPWTRSDINAQIQSNFFMWNLCVIQRAGAVQGFPGRGCARAGGEGHRLELQQPSLRGAAINTQNYPQGFICLYILLGCFIWTIYALCEDVRTVELFSSVCYRWLRAGKLWQNENFTSRFEMSRFQNLQSFFKFKTNITH